MAVQDTGGGTWTERVNSEGTGVFLLSRCSTGMWALGGDTRAQVVIPATSTTGTRDLRSPLSADSVGRQSCHDVNMRAGAVVMYMPHLG